MVDRQYPGGYLSRGRQVCGLKVTSYSNYLCRQPRYLDGTQFELHGSLTDMDDDKNVNNHQFGQSNHSSAFCECRSLLSITKLCLRIPLSLLLFSQPVIFCQARGHQMDTLIHCCLITREGGDPRRYVDGLTCKLVSTQLHSRYIVPENNAIAFSLRLLRTVLHAEFRFHPDTCLGSLLIHTSAR